jgi:hypothetical protein
MKLNLYIMSVIALVLSLSPINASAEGKHNGEVKQLEVDISFSGDIGTTVTDNSGTWFHVWGMVFYEPKIYIEKYQGVFPLYLMGMDVGITVTVKNNGPRQRAKLTIGTEAYSLRTNGDNGVPLTAPRTIDVVVEKGETKVIDASFVAGIVPDAESGLDRFQISVWHTNSGKAENQPALIMSKEGIFCPPAYGSDAHRGDGN